MRCNEIMNARVEIVRMAEPVRAAAERMRDHDIGFLPVLDEKDLVVGTITDRDITIRATAEGKGIDTPIADCMTREVIACFASDDVDKAEDLMAAYQKSRIVVLDDQGKLAGVISLADLARNRDKQETGEAMRDIKAESPPAR
jgi:CBS domain-containing protein